MNAELRVGGRFFTVTCLSMGNPHCVTFLDQASDELLAIMSDKSAGTATGDPDVQARIEALLTG